MANKSAQAITAKALAGYDSVTLFNAIRNNSPTLKSRFPEATEANLKQIGYNLAQAPEDQRNAYIQELWNVISAIFVKNMTLNNPLSHMLIGGTYFAWGDLIEKIAVRVAKGVSPKYLADNLGTGKTLDPFIQKQPEVVTEFYKSNLPLQYLVTISEWQLQRAFESNNGMQALVAQILDSVMRGINLDLYIAGKEIINGYINDTTHTLSDGQVLELPDVIDESSGKEFVLGIKNIINQLMFPTTAFNPSGLMQTSSSGDFIMYARPQLLNQLSVNVWASAFNRDDLDLTPVDGDGRMRIKTLDNFGGIIVQDEHGNVLNPSYDVLGSQNGWQNADGTEYTGKIVNVDPNEDILAVIATPEAFRIALRKQNYAPIYNPRGEYTNFWYNQEYWCYYSNFENVIIIKKAATA